MVNNIKETKIILDIWKKYIILENKKIYSEADIRLLIDDNLKDILGVEFIIGIKDTGNNVSVYAKSILDEFKIMTSYIDVAKYDHSNKKGIGKGEKNSHWYVMFSESSIKGLGPVLYEVAIEYVSTRKFSSLKPDHTSVSEPAKRVWQIYNKRDDIEKIQLDANSSNLSSNDEIDQITPEIEKDDTDQETAIDDKYKEILDGDSTAWVKSPLSKSYKKENDNIIKYLLSKGFLTIKKNNNKFFIE